MTRILIAAGAAREIESDSRSVGGQRETGGLLIGTTRCQAIVAATRAGPQAEQESHRFTDDPDHQQAQLDEQIRRFAGKVRLLGYWHRHVGMPTPSGGDLNQARELLLKLGGRVLVVVVVVNRTSPQNPQVELNGFELRDGDSGFRPVELVQVPDDSPLIANALTQEATPVQVTDEDFWRNPDFQSYRTAVGRTRIEGEAEVLRAAGFKVQTLKKKGDGRLLLQVQDIRGSLVCVPPPEYPLNPPRLYWAKDETELGALRNALRWSSDSTIRALVEEALNGQAQRVAEQATPPPAKPQAPELPFPYENDVIARFLRFPHDLWVELRARGYRRRDRRRRATRAARR